MNPNMEFVKFFGKNYDADALAEDVVKEIKTCIWWIQWHSFSTCQVGKIL